MRTILVRVAVSFGVLCLLVPGYSQTTRKPLAFPGAEGFGAFAQGGRGGKVLFVTKLEDYVPGKDKPIPGSLRAALDAKGPRTVLFRVSGTIPLKTGLVIKEPCLTLAGQTAPGSGICLKDNQTAVATHDVIIRHVRFRPGDEPGSALRARGER